MDTHENESNQTNTISTTNCIETTAKHTSLHNITALYPIRDTTSTYQNESHVPKHREQPASGGHHGGGSTRL
jgi:hypothetical protein